MMARTGVDGSRFGMGRALVCTVASCSRSFDGEEDIPINSLRDLKGVSVKRHLQVCVLEAGALLPHGLSQQMLISRLLIRFNKEEVGYRHLQAIMP